MGLLATSDISNLFQMYCEKSSTGNLLIALPESIAIFFPLSPQLYQLVSHEILFPSQTLPQLLYSLHL